MESGWIGDADITASSYLDEDHAPHKARLYGNSSWRPLPNDTKPFIQVNRKEYESTMRFSVLVRSHQIIKS